MITFFPILVGTQSSGTGGGGPVGDRNITGIAEEFDDISVENGTPFEELPLPTNVDVNVSDGTLANALLLWEVGDYDGDINGEYDLEATIIPPSGITNSLLFSITIKVTVVPSATYDYYVETSANGGDDGDNGMTPTTPFATVQRAIQVAEAAGGNKSIKVGIGTFTVPAYIILDNPGINIYGSGIDFTIIKGATGLNHTFVPYNYATDKFLIQINPPSGNLTLRDLTIEGNNTAIHGGIYVNANNVTLQDVKVTSFGFMGVYIRNTSNFKYLGGQIINCAYSSQVFSSGCLSLGTNTDTEIDNLFINADEGYGVKGFGPPPVIATHTRLKMTNSYVSVIPSSNYGSGNIPNISFEIHDNLMVNCLLDNNRTDNTVSLVRPLNQQSTGIKTVRVTNHFFDQVSRAGSGGYCLELAVHNAEIDHNYFLGGGNAAIAHWNANETQAADGWDIHHNVFENQQSFYPSGIVRSSYAPLKNVNFFNNLVYVPPTSNRTVAIIFTERGITSQNVKVKNNILWIRSTSSPPSGEGGASSLVRLDGGGGITGFECTHNIINGIPQGSLPGGIYNNNIFTAPQINLVGAKPDPYFRPIFGSNAIGAGVNVGLPFSGSAPTIGPYELEDVAEETSVQEIADINDKIVASGVAFNALGLPATVNVKLTNTTTISSAIDWAVGSYTPTQGVYNLEGTISLPSGILNPTELKAKITIIVVDAEFFINDSFDRGSLGGNYVIEGDLNVTLDGVNLHYDGTDGLATNRIRHIMPLTDIGDIELTLLHEVKEINATSYGVGIGIQNTVNPDPNKGIHTRLNLSSSPTFGGVLAIYSGQSDLNNQNFTQQVFSNTKLTVDVGDIYEIKIKYVMNGNDLVVTATARNVDTDEIIEAITWTEVGAASMLYRGTSYVTIFHNGGEQQTNLLTAQDISVVSPFPNVLSVTPFSKTVANGTAFNAIGLPTIVLVELSDGSTPSYNVAWTQGGYSPTTAGVYVLQGTITTPPNVTNTGNLRATATITVQSPTTGGVEADWWVATNGNNANDGTQAEPFQTLQKAFDEAQPGDIIIARGGTYRETVTPPTSGTALNPITLIPYPGETVTISGLNEISDTGWTVHSGQIYKKTIALPVTGFNQAITGNTVLAANQIFKNGEMMFEARYPKINSMDALFARANYRHVDNMQSFTSTSLQDNTLPDIGTTYVGAKIWINGWYVSGTRTITSNTLGSKVLGYSAYSDNGASGLKRRRYFYVTGKLGLLTAEKEWHYEGGVLYFRQPGGGSPTGVEHKARNWAFDLRNRSHITIGGIHIMGCDIIGNTSTSNIIIDNIRASYINHTVLQEGADTIYYNARQTGIRLLGSNNLIKNSEIKYAASAGIWLGNNCTAQNNYLHHIGYEGQYGAPFMLDANAAGYKVLNNTCHTLGRSAFDFGWQEGGSHLNGEIAYNDFYDYGKLNVDMGGIYGARHQNSFGTVIHHNWLHDTGTGADEGGSGDLGTNAGMYLDQGFGPITYHHNVEWNNILIGYFTNPTDGGRTMPDSSYLYHNVFATNLPGPGARHSYKLGGGVPAKQDTQRNNIYEDDIIANLGQSTPNVANSVLAAANPQFLGNGSTNSGLDFRVGSGSPARNIGINIPGITPTVYDTNPTAGAYQYGDPAPWRPGYNALPFDDGGSEPGGGGEDPTPALFEAEDAIEISAGVVRGETNLGSFDNNDYAKFHANLEDEKDTIRLSYGRQWSSPSVGQLEIRKDTVGGTLLATINLPNTGAWGTYQTIEATLSEPVSGEFDWFVVGKTSGTGNLDWFEFTGEPTVDTGNIASLDAIPDKEVAFNTDFGTNGAGIGLPQTIEATLEGGGTGTVALTWAIGTYDKLGSAWVDTEYVLTGTPVETDDISNDDDVVVTCGVTVKNILKDVNPADIAVIWDPTKMATNTNNIYGTVDASDNATLVKSLAPGPLGEDLEVVNTAPKLDNGRLKFIETGEYQQDSVNTALEFLHYKAIPADLKATIFMAGVKVTNTGYCGLMGNNGAWSALTGFALTFNGTNNAFGVSITNSNSGSPAIIYSNASVIDGANENTYVVQIDNALAGAAGKVKVYRDTTVYNSTTTGSGILVQTPAPSNRFRLGSFGNPSNDMNGTHGVVIILKTVYSDEIRNKIASDLKAYIGTPSGGGGGDVEGFDYDFDLNLS